MANPAGESNNGALGVDFDRLLMLQSRGWVVTSDAGLLADRELGDTLGLSAMAGEALADARTGKNRRHALVGMGVGGSGRGGDDCRSRPCAAELCRGLPVVIMEAMALGVPLYRPMSPASQNLLKPEKPAGWCRLEMRLPLAKRCAPLRRFG